MFTNIIEAKGYIR